MDVQVDVQVNVQDLFLLVNVEDLARWWPLYSLAALLLSWVDDLSSHRTHCIIVHIYYDLGTKDYHSIFQTFQSKYVYCVAFYFFFVGGQSFTWVVGVTKNACLVISTSKGAGQKQGWGPRRLVKTSKLFVV